MSRNNAHADYRVNTRENSNISIEIKCCGQHIGEVRFKDGESRECSRCRAKHVLRIEHNHFHISRYLPEEQ